MLKIEEIMAFFDEFAPAEASESWDNDGLLLCRNEKAEVKRALTCLDVTEGVIEKAVSDGFDLIVSHHPLIMDPLKALYNTPLSRKLFRLIENNISVISLHTRLDAAPRGNNARLAEILGLNDIKCFNSDGEISDTGIGRIGVIKEISPEELAAFVKKKLLLDDVALTDAKRRISRVAIVSGAGKSEIPSVIKLGADAFISGDISYHAAMDALENGLSVIDAGHFGTEKIAADILEQALCSVGVNAEAYYEINPTRSI